GGRPVGGRVPAPVHTWWVRAVGHRLWSSAARSRGPARTRGCPAAAGGWGTGSPAGRVCGPVGPALSPLPGLLEHQRGRLARRAADAGEKVVAAGLDPGAGAGAAGLRAGP